MALNAPTRAIAGVYTNIVNTALKAKAVVPGMATAAASAHSAQLVRNDWIPFLKSLATVYPPSSAFPQAWKDSLAAYANEQDGITTKTSAQYVADFDGVGNAARAALAAVIASIPVDGNGVALLLKFDSSGEEAWETLSGSATVAAAFTALNDALG